MSDKTNVISITSRRKQKNQPQAAPDALALLKFADQIDSAFIQAIEDRGLDPKEVAGVTGNRLANLIMQFEENEELLDAIVEIMRKKCLEHDSYEDPA